MKILLKKLLKNNINNLYFLKNNVTSRNEIENNEKDYFNWTYKNNNIENEKFRIDNFLNNLNKEFYNYNY